MRTTMRLTGDTMCGLVTKAVLAVELEFFIKLAKKNTIIMAGCWIGHIVFSALFRQDDHSIYTGCTICTAGNCNIN